MFFDEQILEGGRGLKLGLFHSIVTGRGVAPTLYLIFVSLPKKRVILRKEDFLLDSVKQSPLRLKLSLLI
jgi:hypothetical protein